MDTIGGRAVPAGFRYRDVLMKGMPDHDPRDAFRVRHPRMETGRRAKIFAPFDALRGFDEAVSARDVLYRDRIVLSPDEEAELDRRLAVLRALTGTGKARVPVTVTYYEPCSDEDHEDCGIRGRYLTLAGVCGGVDTEETRTVLVGGERIPLDDIMEIGSPLDIFRTSEED